MRRKIIQLEKLYWKSLPKDCRLRFDGSSYFYNGALIYYFGSEVIDAERFLKTRIRY